MNGDRKYLPVESKNKRVRLRKPSKEKQKKCLEYVIKNYIDMENIL